MYLIINFLILIMFAIIVNKLLTVIANYIFINIFKYRLYRMSNDKDTFNMIFKTDMDAFENFKEQNVYTKLTRLKPDYKEINDLDKI